jgi:high affinity sulfate transporter 1
MNTAVAERPPDRREHPLTRRIPIVGWLPRYDRHHLSGDAVAGATVAAIVVPEGVAYAGLAGMPPQASLYAAPVALIAYAVFGRSRHMIVGATSAVSIMSASTVAELALEGSDRFIALSTELALLVGLLFLLFGFLKLGFIAQFFSESVLKGFVFGLAMVIAIGQAAKLFGLERPEGNFFEKAWQIISHLGETNPWAFFIGATSLALLFGIERFAHRVPAALAALVYGIGLVSILGLGDRLPIVGAIPAGLPTPAIPELHLQDLVALLPGALGLLLVTFAEHIGPVRQLAAKHRYETDGNQELIALGAANVGAGFVRGFAQGGSLSRSAANDAAGGTSQVSGLVAAALVLLVAALFTPLFYNLPEATLGAIVIHAVWSLFDVDALRRYARLNRLDFVIAVAALLGVLALDTLPGLLIAVVLSLVLLIYKASRPHIATLGRSPDGTAIGDIAQHPDYRPAPGVLTVRPDAPLFFANGTVLRDAIREDVRAASPRPRAVLLDLEATSEIDIPTNDMLGELAEDLGAEGVELRLARVRAPVRRLLTASGVAARIGEAKIHPRVEDGLRALEAEGGGDGSDPRATPGEAPPRDRGGDIGVAG